MANTTRPESGPNPAEARTAKARFSEIVLVCAKCAKRQSLRPRDLRGRVKDALKRAGGRKVRVVETGCLGPCPKRLLALATGSSVAAGRILLLDPAADAAEMARAILPGRSLPDFGPKPALPPGHAEGACARPPSSAPAFP